MEESRALPVEEKKADETVRVEPLASAAMEQLLHKCKVGDWEALNKMVDVQQVLFLLRYHVISFISIDVSMATDADRGGYQ